MKEKSIARCCQSAPRAVAQVASRFWHPSGSTSDAWMAGAGGAWRVGCGDTAGADCVIATGGGGRLKRIRAAAPSRPARTPRAAITAGESDEEPPAGGASVPGALKTCWAWREEIVKQAHAA